MNRNYIYNHEVWTICPQCGNEFDARTLICKCGYNYPLNYKIL